MKRFFKFGCLTLLILIAIAVFGMTRGSDKPPAPPAAVGQPVRVKNWTVTVQAADRPGKTLTWSKYDNTSEAVGTWLVVAVDLTNTGTSNFGVNAHDFTLHAGKVKYNVTDDLGALSISEYKGGKSISSQVPPGATVRLYIPYDVNPSATEITMTFNQGDNPTFAIP